MVEMADARAQGTRRAWKVCVGISMQPLIINNEIFFIEEYSSCVVISVKN